MFWITVESRCSIHTSCCGALDIIMINVDSHISTSGGQASEQEHTIVHRAQVIYEHHCIFLVTNEHASDNAISPKRLWSCTAALSHEKPFLTCGIQCFQQIPYN